MAELRQQLTTASTTTPPTPTAPAATKAPTTTTTTTAPTTASTTATEEAEADACSYGPEEEEEAEDAWTEADHMPLAGDSPAPAARTSSWSRISQELSLTKRYERALELYYGRGGALQDTNGALKMLESCATDNHLGALTSVALMSYHGWHHTLGSRDRAVRMLREASERGDVLARQLCLRFGVGCEVDESRVLPLLMRADQHNPLVMFHIAECHLYGIGTPKQPIIGMQWMLKAAQAGLPAAYFWAGVNYQQGLGVKASPSKSLKNFRLAAERGIPSAMTHLAMAYEEGLGLAKDAHQALYWYKRAAEAGDELAAEIVRHRATV